MSEKNCVVKQKFNNLTGAEWLKYSISIWSDVKNGEDKVDHPAVFPAPLVEKILKCYTNSSVVVLDPFAGSGTVLYVACLLGHKAIGFEIYEKYVRLIEERTGLFKSNCSIIHDTVENAGSYLEKSSVDILITSSPYWNILKKKRTADRKDSKFYGDNPSDIGNIADYDEYLRKLSQISKVLKEFLKPEAHMFINVMNIREKSKFYPLHIDLVNHLKDAYLLEDIIIWDRRQEYNNLKPLGYPYRFVINRVHEYILIFRVTHHGVSK